MKKAAWRASVSERLRRKWFLMSSAKLPETQRSRSSMAAPEVGSPRRTKGVRGAAALVDEVVLHGGGGGRQVAPVRFDRPLELRPGAVGPHRRLAQHDRLRRHSLGARDRDEVLVQQGEDVARGQCMVAVPLEG